MFKDLIEKIIVFKQDSLRNIATILRSEDLLNDLSDDPQDWAFGEALVSEANVREDFYSPVVLRPFSYGVSLNDASSISLSTRFSDGKFGVWYGSLDLLTTIYETAYHFKKRIKDMLMTITEEVISERRVFKVMVDGILVDLRGKHHKFPRLLDVKDYSFCHSVGTYLHDNGQKGILIESARYHKGVNVATFTPDILFNPVHHSYLVYRWNPGEPAVKIEKTPGRTWKVLNIPN